MLTIYFWQSVSNRLKIVDHENESSIITRHLHMLIVYLNRFCQTAKKLPKNEGAGSQGNGQGRRLDSGEQSRQPNSSINCCK